MRGLAGLSVQQRLAVGAAAVVAVAGPAAAQTRTFDVPAGPASLRLPTLARQAGIQILAKAQTVRSKRTNAVRGDYPVEEALRLLLKGTGLRARAAGNDIVTIVADARAPARPRERPRTPAPRQEERALRDIVVTARFVEEDIQDTPMAITAQTGSQLAAANVTNIGTLGAVVPNLWTVPGDARSAGTPLLTMRGVRQGDTSSYASPPGVAIYIDDVYHATTAGSELDMADVDHIEVNRGPQSTLSGNASSGGSIKLYTRDPAGDGSGHAALTVGSRDRLGASGAVDLGLSPTLALRMSGSFDRQTGFVDRLDFTCQMNRQGTPELAGSFPLARPDSAARGCVLGHLGGGTRVVGQAKLRWRPNDRIDLIVTARKRVERLEETPELALGYQPNPSPNPNSVVEIYNRAIEERFGIRLDGRFLPPPDNPYATYATNCRPSLALNGTLPAVNGVYVPSGFCYGTSKSLNHGLVSAKLHYELSDKVRMTAIGARTEYDYAFTTNGDQSPLGYSLQHSENRTHQTSGELRLDGSLWEDRLDWVAGGFWFGLKGYPNGFLGFMTQTSFSNDRAEIGARSGFFHLDYRIADKWRVSGGARYTSGRIRYYLDHPPVLTLAEPATSRQKRWDWLLSTDYKITDDILLYASAATGSRPPGIVTIIYTVDQFRPTPGEELISYEAGVKASLPDRRVRMNLAAFRTDFRSLSMTAGGYQCLGQPGPATWFPIRETCLQFADASSVGWFLPVAVPASVTGFEWEVSAAPVDGLRIDWSGGYNDFRSGIRTPGAPGYLWPGNHRQPSWDMHAGASYDIATPIGTFTPLLSWSWQSQQDFDPISTSRAPLPVYVVEPYGIWNAQLAYRSEDGGWSAALTVNNLADRFHNYLVIQGTINTQSRAAPPREFALTLRRNF